MSDPAIALIILLFAFLLTSAPIAVAIGMTSFVYFFYFTTVPLTQVPERLFNSLNSFPLMAIPFFVFGANVMTHGGISKRLTDFSNVLVGRFRGGLAMTAVLACMFFAAVSGSSPATVVAVGTLMIPAMIAAGYPRQFSTGIIASSGSLGILIPPSIPLIVYGIATEQSIGDLFLAGIVPGLMAGTMLLVTVVIISRRKGYGWSGPAVAAEGSVAGTSAAMSAGESAGGAAGGAPDGGSTRAITLHRVTGKEKLAVFRSAILSLMLPVIVLGGIYGGIFTPTEAAAAAAGYALVIALFVYRDLKVTDLWKVVISSTKTSAMIMFIIANGILFTFVLTTERIPGRVTDSLLAADLSAWQFLLITNVILLVVGCFMETSSAILILAPILFTIGTELGIDPIHLGVVMIMNLEIGMVTPPFGLNLFVASGLSGMSVVQVAKAALPTAAVLLTALFMVTYIPQISLVLLGR
ncbi:MAG: TRAP transporter large permease [Austwickia sp.]|nr:TRAP transporter large permease [Austwickia sp.]MBK9100365.1 TRAP transporter large permease [Austwickia sp.]